MSDANPIVRCVRCRRRVARDTTDVCASGFLCRRCAGFHHAEEQLDRMRNADPGALDDPWEFSTRALAARARRTDADRLAAELLQVEARQGIPEAPSGTSCEACGRNLEHGRVLLQDANTPLCADCFDGRVGSLTHGLLLGVFFSVPGALFASLLPMGKRTRAGAWFAALGVLGVVAPRLLQALLARHF
ncbi:MAG: hypothetical protein U0271_40680 [Polyangiaceae bacterium]